ncbi:TIGR04053 family radical SAM/SPASM domain-containing protein [Halopenitus sp. POP-27]|uniref:TIGR04053 family radical SAM/SPASM domain-containing protein n=1 Tax=Halopenitus sp. POP-27 TaxID=2994425 RepID=UPI00246856F0|nr:TIGR04053 family radical SAM/SPASM domain-containing protein [Halopenitus sp. POP-27]
MFDHIDTDRRPVVLIWEVTQACELACRHCRADAQPARHPDELTTAEGKRLLEDAAEFGENQLVVLSGGDPLTRPDLLELVEHGDDLGLRMTITPSGTRSLSPDCVADLADAGVRRMALSLDGATAATHDAFRGEESFADTIAAAAAAADEGLPLQINTTVCADTVEELPAIRDRVRDLGAVLWSVFFLVPVGRGRVLDPIAPGRAEAVMEWLQGVSESEPFGVKTTEAPFYRRVGLQRAADADEPNADEPNADESNADESNAEASPRRAGITAGRGFAFVSHTGEVYPSGFLPESAGNVRDRSVVDVYRNADLFEDLRDPDAYRGKCGACEFRHVCGGSRSRAYAMTGDPLESDPLCPYIPEGYEGSLPETITTSSGPANGFTSVRSD